MGLELKEWIQWTIGEYIMSENNVRIVRLFWKKCKEDHIGAYAAQSAFFVILSIVPFLMLFTSLIQYTPVSEEMILNLVGENVPEYFSPYLITLIHEMYTNSVGLISATAIAAVWASAKGMHFLSGGLNSVYDIKETRNYFVLRFRAILYTLVFLAAIIFAMMLLVFGTFWQKFLAVNFPILNSIGKFVMEFRVMISLFVFVFFFALLFKMLPNRKATLKSQLPGSVICAAGWYIMSFALSFYMKYFNGFSMYGRLATVVVVMLWFYFGIYLMLICGEINDGYRKWKK